MIKKDILEKIIAFFSYYTGLVHLLRFYQQKMSLHRKVIILAYHSIGKIDFIPEHIGLWISEKLFLKHMDYLSKYYRAVPLDAIEEMFSSDTANAVIITFDDGYHDNYVNAYPILRSHNFPATIFLTTNYIGTGTKDALWLNKLYWWFHATNKSELTIEMPSQRDREKLSFNIESQTKRKRCLNFVRGLLKSLDETERKMVFEQLAVELGFDVDTYGGLLSMLSWDEVREMSKNKISFGAHGKTHAILTKLPHEEIYKEVLESKIKIEEKAGQEVKYFSYPNGGLGDFDQETKKILKGCGYRGACTLLGGYNTENTSLYELKRIGIGNKPTYVLATELVGIFDLLRKLIGFFRRLMINRRRD